jgi:hypothetical protein
MPVATLSRMVSLRPVSSAAIGSRWRLRPARKTRTGGIPWRSPGCAPYADARKPRARDEQAERTLEAKIEAIKSREEEGGFAEAVLRIMLAVAQAEHMFDARGLRLVQRIKQEHPVLGAFTRARVKAAAKEEAFMLRFDEERALNALPLMLPTEKGRREAVDIVRADRLRRRRDHAGERGHARADRAYPRPRQAGGGQARDQGCADAPGPTGRQMKKERDPVDVAPPQTLREYRVYPALIARCASLEPVTTAVAHPCDEASLTGALEPRSAA